jgi:hypothetical protein
VSQPAVRSRRQSPALGPSPNDPTSGVRAIVRSMLASSPHRQQFRRLFRAAVRGGGAVRARPPACLAERRRRYLVSRRDLTQLEAAACEVTGTRLSRSYHPA